MLHSDAVSFRGLGCIAGLKIRNAAVQTFRITD